MPQRQAGASAHNKAYKPEEIINVGEDLHWSESGENQVTTERTTPNINVDIEELDESNEEPDFGKNRGDYKFKTQGSVFVK